MTDVRVNGEAGLLPPCFEYREFRGRELFSRPLLEPSFWDSADKPGEVRRGQSNRRHPRFVAEILPL